MAGYLTTSGSWTVSDVGPSSYPHTVTATLTVTAGTGSSCDWKVAVSRPNWNFYQIYLKIDDTVLLNNYITGNSKTYSHSGTATISGDDISITLGIATSQKSTSSSRMTYIYKTLTREKWAAVTPGEVSIVDNFNNSCTITARSGVAQSENNPVKSALLTYSYTTKNGTNTIVENLATTGEEYSVTVNFNDFIDSDSDGTLDNTRKVTATVQTVGQYNTPESKTASKNIVQIVGPSYPGEPSVTFKKTRPTVKENWKFEWESADPANNESPIKGYRIRLYKNGIKKYIKHSSGKDLSVLVPNSSDPNNIQYDREGTENSITIYPDKQEFKPGDVIKLSVSAYTRYGDNNDGAQVFKTSEQFSAEYTVRNAGIVRLKTDEGWKEGQVYVKLDHGWVEAETVYVKTDDGWEESE
jgi:hypothetical protein